MKVVVDRFEGDWAVLLTADQQQITISRDKLPAGVGEGDHLQITLQNGEIVQATLDEQATADARRRIQAKLDRLRRGGHLEA